MADCQNCPMEVRVKKLEEDLRELREHSSGARSNIYDRLNKLEQAEATTDARYVNIMDELADQKKELKEIRDCLNELRFKPGQRWETAVAAALSALIGGVIAYFVSGELK